MFNEDLLIKELEFKAIRSSGSGGQHVNKVSSKIELSFNLENSTTLSFEQKELLTTNLKTKLSKDSVIILQCDETRSQHRNKELVIRRFIHLIKNNLTVQKKRKPTKIPNSVKLKRLKSKRLHADKKVNRKKPDLD